MTRTDCSVSKRTEELRAENDDRIEMKWTEYPIELKNRFMELPKEDPVTAKHDFAWKIVVQVMG